MLLYNSIRGVGSLFDGFQAKKNGIRQVGFVPPPPSPSIGVGMLKIAVVPGATPFLLSNTLLRALGGMIDTTSNSLVMPKHGTQVTLELSPKGLYLLDVNKLIQAGCKIQCASKVAETFAQDSLADPAKIAAQRSPQKDVVQRCQVTRSGQVKICSVSVINMPHAKTLSCELPQQHM